MSGRRAAWLVLTMALAAAAAPARAQDDGPPPDGTDAAVPAVVVTDLPCERRADALHTEAPRLVYDDRPDLLYELLLGLEDGCEIGEPAGRMRILASIWDGVIVRLDVANTSLEEEVVVRQQAEREWFEQAERQRVARELWRRVHPEQEEAA